MLIPHALLAVAAWALAGTGVRVAGRHSADALERAVVALTVATAAGVAEALLLGRVGLAGEPVALTGAAVATWLVARGTLPRAPATGWRWRRLSRAERAGLGAAGGALLALVAWTLRHPALGVDGVFYHLPEVVSWVHAGNTGATPHVSAEFPTGSYPLTNEVALAWAMGIAHSFVPVALWMGLMTALLAGAGWLGLRRLGCGPLTTALAIGAVLALPLAATQSGTPKNDLPALAWLAACAALCTARRPALLGFAVLAAGLSVGTKTTTAPLAVAVLAAGLWACRDVRRRLLVRPLAFGFAAALAVGGLWYVRNVIAHGSPLWPVVAGPGDPEPFALRRIDVTFLQRPHATLEGRTDVYARVLAGGLLLLAGGVASAILARRRMVVLAAGATAASVLVWATAPFTGRADNPVLDLSVTTTRYLLPAMAAGAVALALAARTSRLAAPALAGALVWSLARTHDLGFPDVPSAGTLVAGALIGAAAAVLMRRVVRTPVVALAVAAGVVVCAGAASGFTRRHAETSSTAAAPLVALFANAPGWADSRAPVAFSPRVAGPVAGDRLRHRVSLVPPAEGCTAVHARARHGYVVIERVPFPELLAPTNAPRCLAADTPVATAGTWVVYGPAPLTRQTATRSSAPSSPFARSSKSSTPIAAARGSAVRRARTSSAS